MQDALQQGQNVRNGADLLVGNQNVGVREFRDGVLVVRRHIGRDETTVKLHTLGVLFFHREATALFHGDDAVFANFVHYIGDKFANFAVSGGDRGHLSYFFACLDRFAHRLDFVDDGLNALLQSTAQDHRIGASGEIPEAFDNDGLCQDGRGGGTITSHIICFGRDLFQQLRAHILKWLGQIDITSNGYTIIGNGWCTKLFVKHNIAALWPKCDFDGFCQRVDALFKGTTRLFIKL